MEGKVTLKDGVGGQHENMSSSSLDSRQDGTHPEGSNKSNQFMQNVAKANENMICRATAQDVRTVSMLTLLKNGLRIPIFQRRYCKKWEFARLSDEFIVW